MSATATPYLDFVVLYVCDLEAAVDYYLKLGFTLFAQGSGPDFKQLEGRKGSPGLGLLKASSATPSAGEVELYFKTADQPLAEWREGLVEKGIEAVRAVFPILMGPYL